MAKKKVKVLNAVVDGHTRGDVFEVDAKSAEMLVKNGYVEYVSEPKKEAPKKEATKKDAEDEDK